MGNIKKEQRKQSTSQTRRLLKIFDVEKYIENSTNALKLLEKVWLEEDATTAMGKTVEFEVLLVRTSPKFS